MNEDGSKDSGNEDPPPPPPSPPEEEEEEEEEDQHFRPDLPDSIFILVKDLWTLLDRKKKGYIRTADFIRLGQAMTQTKPTIASAEFMLEQANISGSGRVDRDEWMSYCERLKRMPVDLCTANLEAFIARLGRINAKELEALEDIAMRGVRREEQEDAAMEREIANMMKK